MEIEKLTFNGGRGLARFGSAVIFVPYVIPGETVRVRLEKVAKNYAEASLVKVLRTSPLRRQPPCPVAEKCGGCHWQHIPYEEQLRQKQILLEEFISRARVGTQFEMRAPIAAPREFRYRNRIQVNSVGERWGYFARGSHNLVEITDCLIADERLIAGTRELRAKLQGRSAHSKARFEIALEKSGRVSVAEGQRAPDSALFSQVFTEQNQRLIEMVAAALPKMDITPEKILDLYCGDGNLTFPLAKTCPKSSIVGVELSQSSVERAQLAVNGQKIEFIADDVARYLKNQISNSFGVVVLDPPRVGVTQLVIDELLRLKIPHLIHVSCHLATLARDLQKLVAGGYELHTVQGLDMFPQTDYLETVSVLRRAQ